MTRNIGLDKKIYLKQFYTLESLLFFNRYGIIFKTKWKSLENQI